MAAASRMSRRTRASSNHHSTPRTTGTATAVASSVETPHMQKLNTVKATTVVIVTGDGDMVQQKLEEVDQYRREERVSDGLENMSSNDMKKGVDGAVRASKVINWDNMAKHHITKFYALKSQLQGVSLRIQKIMREFEMQNKKMEMVGELMNDAFDDALEGDEEEKMEYNSNFGDRTSVET
ncbi:Vacuolar protein sorting-associated protein 2 1 [Zea mays]|uniref:Vacuolar protein sorting-associated protein 2 1 n=2 Tax=Zea mays TaxID=4577 RepID=A0A8J8YR63_MAIZE|nr:hypothetical protein ZEAMMB73_Zm00001d050122 [Zea mays]PWZ28864.1 Vacuolar protein sorting-associated protein 2 1 [Zea mays]